MIVTCMLNFSISLHTVYLPSKKTKNKKQKPHTFNTIKLKIGLRYPLRNSLVGEKFQGTNQKKLSVLGTMYFKM